jgi:nucleoside-diphosphate-sugar epimerase
VPVISDSSGTRAEAFKGRVALVTGGFGFIGSNLVLRLIELGAEVRVLARSWPPQREGSDEYQLPTVRLFKGDIRDEAVVREATEGCDFVFHLAGKSGASSSNESPLEDLDVNCRGLLLLLNAVRHLAPGAVLVFPSSRLVYAPSLPLPVTELAQTLPLSIYGAHKLASENYLHIYRGQFGLKGVVLRITNPYGPFQRPEQRSYGVINQFIHEAVRGQTITLFGNGNQLRDYIHIDDVVEALLSAATSPAAVNGIFNVGSGHGTSLAELSRLIVEIAGSGRVEHVDWPGAEARVETGDFVADISHITAATGWTPRVALRDGLRRVMSQIHKAPTSPS